MESTFKVDNCQEAFNIISSHQLRKFHDEFYRLMDSFEEKRHDRKKFTAEQDALYCRILNHMRKFRIFENKGENP